MTTTLDLDMLFDSHDNTTDIDEGIISNQDCDNTLYSKEWYEQSSINDLTELLNNPYLQAKYKVLALEYISCSTEGDVNSVITSTLSSMTTMFNISGSKELENIFQGICESSRITPMFKLGVLNTLHAYTKEVKDENDKVLRVERTGKILDNFCYSIERAIPTTLKVKMLYMLLEYQQHQDSAISYFKEFVRKDAVDARYKYEAILEISKLTNVANSENTVLVLFLEMMHCADAVVDLYYKILAGQYILCNTKQGDDTECDNAKIRNSVQKHLLAFATDESKDYNRRADSADILITWGDARYRETGTAVIAKLGACDDNSECDQKPSLYYNNKQNVHMESVSSSVTESIKFLMNNIKTCMMSDGITQINLLFIRNEIDQYFNSVLKDQEVAVVETAPSAAISTRSIDDPLVCEGCGKTFSSDLSSTISSLTTNSMYSSASTCKTLGSNITVCSHKCFNMLAQISNVNLALTRIRLDNGVYTHYMVSLKTVLIKLWSYMMTHKYSEGLKSRIIDELADMAHTCASGYISRLINSATGFGDFGVTISWEDQLKSCFANELNECIKCITNEDSLFRTDSVKRKDVVTLWMNKPLCELESCNTSENSDKESRVLKRRSSIEKSHPRDATNEQIKSDYITNETLYEKCLVEFQENVLYEITIDPDEYNKRKNFMLFFYTYLHKVKEVLKDKFCNDISDTDFELYFRGAMTHYECG